MCKDHFKTDQATGCARTQRQGSHLGMGAASTSTSWRPGFEMTKIYISEGEASGDLLGADLAKTLLQKNPSLHLTGMGGSQMRDAGVDIQFDPKTVSIIGIAEVIKKLPYILWFFHRIKKYLIRTKPDLIILIDFPDTHFRLFKTAQKLNIPILYYTSPQIWAWRASRIKTIQKYVSHMAVLFAFEEKIYRDANVPVTFVGHPLANIAKPTMDKSAAYKHFNLSAEKPIVALFPGSRHSELKMHLPILLASAELIRKENPETQFVLVLANRFDQHDIETYFKAYFKTLKATGCARTQRQGSHWGMGAASTSTSWRPGFEIKVIQNHLYDLLQLTDAEIAVSGTVTLEIALMQVPLCVIYKFGAFNYFLAKLLIRVKHIGLCNIVAENEIAKEFIQAQATSDNIAQEILKLLSDQDYYREKKALYADLRDRVSKNGAHASEIIVNEIIKVTVTG